MANVKGFMLPNIVNQDITLSANRNVNKSQIEISMGDEL